MLGKALKILFKVVKLNPYTKDLEFNQNSVDMLHWLPGQRYLMMAKVDWNLAMYVSINKYTNSLGYRCLTNHPKI